MKSTGALIWLNTCAGTPRAGRWDVIILSMALSIDEVEHIALLARMRLTHDEKELYCEQLSAILDYAARLHDLDTRDIPPTSSVLPFQTVLRTDQSRPGLSRDDVLRNAPEQEDGQFRVPPVLD
jgi:aspartyl-tRNA(Asn)/glutamyl-tRNA(Gln) amidotransferase subunit C